MGDPLTDEEFEAIRKEPSHCADWEVLQLIGMVDALRAEVKQERAERKRLRDVVRRGEMEVLWRDRAKEAEATIDALRAELEALSRRFVPLNNQNEDLGIKLAAVVADRWALRAEVDELTAELHGSRGPYCRGVITGGFVAEMERLKREAVLEKEPCFSNKLADAWDEGAEYAAEQQAMPDDGWKEANPYRDDEESSDD